jgi:hypothetical protein
MRVTAAILAASAIFLGAVPAPLRADEPAKKPLTPETICTSRPMGDAWPLW